MNKTREEWEKVREDQWHETWRHPKKGERLINKELLQFILSTEHAREVQDAYTQGRVDEAKTCTGCQDEHAREVEEAVEKEKKRILVTATEKLLLRNIPGTVGYSVAVEYIYEINQALTPTKTDKQ